MTDAAQDKPDDYPVGHCEGCGQDSVQADHGPIGGDYGHTVPGHAPGCWGTTGCPDCPVPESCGPIKVPPSLEVQDAEIDARTKSPEMAEFVKQTLRRIRK